MALPEKISWFAPVNPRTLIWINLKNNKTRKLATEIKLINPVTYQLSIVGDLSDVEK